MVILWKIPLDRSALSSLICGMRSVQLENSKTPGENRDRIAKMMEENSIKEAQKKAKI